MPEAQTIALPRDFFPFESARIKQIKALDFIYRAVIERNYRDVVIEAPTGTGKASLGVAAAFWGLRLSELDGFPQAYYLVTQKMLQDQLEGEFQVYRKPYRQVGKSLKTAAEYPCPSHGKCNMGLKARSPHHCEMVREELCSYGRAKDAFIAAPVSVTNYPYFFTERTFVGQFQKRRVLLIDECHSIERQLLSFVELKMTPEILEDTAPSLLPLDHLPELDDFIDWLCDRYLPVLKRFLVAIAANASQGKLTREQQVKYDKYERLMAQVQASLGVIDEDRSNWVYWQEENEDGLLVSNAKPIDASPFAKKLLFSQGSLRIHMSAYPGPKHVYCRSLGLDPERVAWIRLGSMFPLENRPVHILNLGSMGRKHQEQTLPAVLQVCTNVLNQHAQERGIIHCATYKLGTLIFDHLSKTVHRSRLLFPTKAEERDEAFERHCATERSVLISPSMTEGFDLKDELARFQIIAKISFPYLGDPQIQAKKDRDPEWYSMQAVMTLIQAVGRAVRSSADHAVTYVLDSDFQMLYERNKDFFPVWFRDSFIWRQP